MSFFKSFAINLYRIMRLTRPEVNDISQKTRSVSEICKALIFILRQTVKYFLNHFIPTFIALLTEKPFKICLDNKIIGKRDTIIRHGR